MAASRLSDPNVSEFLQMALFSLILAVVMVVFAFQEKGGTTKALGFGAGAVFLLSIIFFGITTFGMVRGRPTSADS